MSVVCRMQVNSVEALLNGAKVKLGAVYTADENDPHYAEIKSFFEATPSGTFEAFIKSTAAEQFQPGDQFYLRLDKVEVGGA